MRHTGNPVPDSLLQAPTVGVKGGSALTATRRHQQLEDQDTKPLCTLALRELPNPFLLILLSSSGI